MSNKKTAHTDAELIKIFKKNNIDKKFYDKFIAYYKSCFDELYEDWNDDDWEEGDSVQSIALWSTNRFIKRYLEHIAKGHGDKWSHNMADTDEEEERAVHDFYSQLMKINPELAKKELLIHAQSFGEDKYFEKHYIFLLEMSETHNIVKTAQRYSKIYKEEIAKGKTVIYAHEYADLMAGGNLHEIYCEEYAFAYDAAIKDNKSENYARVYAEKYGSALVDIKRRYAISDDEEMIDFAIQKVKAYMNAWEYGTANKLANFKGFADIYENVYLNALYSEDYDINQSEVEFEKQVLKEALEKFNKIST